MPVTDVRVTLRVASSDHLRPRAWQGTAVAISATIQDQDGAAVAGAVATLSWVAPDGQAAQTEPLTSDVAGRVTGTLLIPGTGGYAARCRVSAPIVRVAQQRFDMVAGVVAPVSDPATPVVTDDGVFLVLPSGAVAGGVL